MNILFCFDCWFFIPEGRRFNDLTEDQWDDCMEGECHAGVPKLGQMLTDRHGDPFRDFGEWPKVMASDWCGKLEPREQSAPQTDPGLSSKAVGEPCVA